MIPAAISGVVTTSGAVGVQGMTRGTMAAADGCEGRGLVTRVISGTEGGSAGEHAFSPRAAGARRLNPTSAGQGSCHVIAE